MNRRHFMTGAAVLTAAPLAAAARTASGRPPDIIVILCDDLGYRDIGAIGAKAIATPHLGRMAARETIVTDFHAAADLCTSSRAGLLTGRHPAHTGLGYHVILQKDDRVLRSSEATIAQALKPAGYVN